MTEQSPDAELPVHPGQWAELVTTALIGTDRRPLDTTDPATTVLRRAARHRVLDRLTPPYQLDRPRPEPAPPQDLPNAPDRADLLLAELLRAPDRTLVSCWLGACVEHSYVVAAVRWTTLARLAARSAAYDRVTLGRALGPRGQWFLRQNSDWRRLAADAGSLPDEPPPPDGVPAAGESSPVTAEEVIATPERIFTAAPPWAPDLVAAAYAVLGGDAALPDRTFPGRLGVALPPELYPTIAQAGQFYLLTPGASPARRRAVRDRFVALELAAYARAAIQHAFTDAETGFTRAEIPHV